MGRTGSLIVGGGDSLTVECDPLSVDNDTIISGLAVLHLTVVANFDGGQVFIEMQDSETGLRLGMQQWM